MIDSIATAKRRIRELLDSQTETGWLLGRMSSGALMAIEERVGLAGLARSKMIGASYEVAVTALKEAIQHETIADGMARGVLMMLDRAQALMTEEQWTRKRASS